MLTSANLQLHCFFPWTNIRGAVHFIILVGDSWHFEVCPNWQDHHIYGQFQGKLCFGKYWQKVGIMWLDKIPTFPKNPKWLFPPKCWQCCFYLTIDKCLTLGEMLSHVNYGQNCERFRLFWDIWPNCALTCTFVGTRKKQGCQVARP